MTKAERTRQYIIEKAAPLFNTRGVAGTSMNDILEVTKLAKGSLYVHFEGKEALSHAVVDYNLARLSGVVERELNRHDTAVAKLFAYIDMFIDTANPPLIGGCPMLNFGMEADDTDQVIREKVGLMIEGAQQQLSTILKKGISAGEFRADWDYREFATRMFAMVEGGIMMSRITGNNKTMKIIAKSLKKEIAVHQI